MSDGKNCPYCDGGLFIADPLDIVCPVCHGSGEFHDKRDERIKELEEEVARDNEALAAYETRLLSSRVIEQAVYKLAKVVRNHNALVKMGWHCDCHDSDAEDEALAAYRAAPPRESK